MRHELDVFDTPGKKMGSLVIMAADSPISGLGPIFQWQWQGKGGSASGLWEWRSSTDWRILLKRSADSLWGTLYGDWKSLPTNHIHRCRGSRREVSTRVI